MSIQGCGSGVDAGIGEAVSVNTRVWIRGGCRNREAVSVNTRVWIRGRCRNMGSSECQYKGVDQGWMQE